MAALLSRESVCRKEDCSPLDIGTMYRVIVSFTDAEKFRYIESIWKPDLLFEFTASKGMAREIPLACLFQVLGWHILFALCLFQNGVWQKWCQTKQAVSIPAHILDDSGWKVRRPFERKVRNSQIFRHGNVEFLGCNEKANHRIWLHRIAMSESAVKMRISNISSRVLGSSFIGNNRMHLF